MDIMEAIFTRRSIRKYKSGNISDETIELLLKSGMYAPSANNFQPWHFIEITEKSILLKIRDFHPYADMLKDASLAIVVCGDQKLDENMGYLALDCAAATENILLAAHGLGLGAVWLGIYPRSERISEINKLLHLPNHIIPITMISIGIPSENKVVQERFKIERIHKNKW